MEDLDHSSAAQRPDQRAEADSYHDRDDPFPCEFFPVHCKQWEMPTGVEPLVIDECKRRQWRIGRLLFRRRDPPWLDDRWKQRRDQNDRLRGDRDRAGSL
jgi:hypothetical protein